MSSTMRRRGPNRSWRSRPCATSATFFGRNSTHSSSPTCSPDGRLPELFESRAASMAPPEDSSQPRLATGCRWGAENKAGNEERVILFPEGAIKLQGTGRQVLERCDGQRTFGQILGELQAQFSDADPAKIRADISQFLEQLRHKRIVDY